MGKRKSRVRWPLLSAMIATAVVWFFSGLITSLGTNFAPAVAHYFHELVTLSFTSPHARVEITYPTGRKPVSSEMQVCARVVGLPAASLRFASRAHGSTSGVGDAHYFPNEFEPHEDHTIGKDVWCIDTLEVGSSADSGKVFDIYALLVSPEDLAAYFRAADRAGLAELPPGIKILDSISVVRN